MMRHIIAAIAALAVSACAANLPPTTPVAQAPIEVQILAFNDFHGNLEPPAPVEVTEPDGTKRKIQAGGIANLAGALASLRQPNSVTVSAGDTIGATPLISAHYLDEPTISAMNLLGLEFNSVGNHEFDRGAEELKRMQNGGCAKFTQRQPCAVEPFAGARFRYLAANVRQADGSTLLPATGLKRFDTPAGPITLGFIGMTLKDTSNLVTPSGVKGLTFADEAATANALVPRLKAEGADAIVLLIHQGGKLPNFTTGNSCDGLYGEILPILAELDPAITTVVSGHTHWAYVCRDTPQVGAGRLMTSAGKYGYFVTDLRLHFDAATRRLLRQEARNVIVGTDGSGVDRSTEALVNRYAAAIKPLADRVVGQLTAPAPDDENDAESPASDLIADSMLAAARAREVGGAQLALVNASGVRIGMPAGGIRYGQAFSMMPFGNNVVVMTLSGAQLKTVLEQQYAKENIASAKRVPVLAPSQGFTYAVNLSRPSMDRIVDMKLKGKPVDAASAYRVAVNNYLASGGDGLPGFTVGTNITDTGIIDLDAFIAWIGPGRTPPPPNRIRVLR